MSDTKHYLGGLLLQAHFDKFVSNMFWIYKYSHFVISLVPVTSFLGSPMTLAKLHLHSTFVFLGHSKEKYAFEYSLGLSY
jgi:hypothetical protein